MAERILVSICGGIIYQCQSNIFTTYDNTVHYITCPGMPAYNSNEKFKLREYLISNKGLLNVG